MASISATVETVRVLEAKAKFDGVLCGAHATLLALGDVLERGDDVDAWRRDFLGRVEEMKG